MFAFVDTEMSDLVFISSWYCEELKRSSCYSSLTILLRWSLQSICC